MIRYTLIYREPGTNPYRNLAIEQFLLENSLSGQCVLYLWQNRRTVVIGRNQNAHAECRVERLAGDGGFLARRLSGGGSVYHDLGNLNFTFLMTRKEFDLDRQLSVIVRACRYFGLKAEISGRNDLCVGGRKFSGNAFYTSRRNSYHHGTVLLSADVEQMSRYLITDPGKLRSKGVKSVSRRVVNLCELNPGITVDGMAAALERAFTEIYEKPHALELSPENEHEIERLAALYSSDSWLIGRKIRADFELGERFEWGAVNINLQIEGGTVVAARVYSDSMDERLSANLENSLHGCAFARDALVRAVDAARAPLGQRTADDIISLLSKQDVW